MRYGIPNRPSLRRQFIGRVSCAPPISFRHHEQTRPYLLWISRQGYAGGARTHSWLRTLAETKTCRQLFPWYFTAYMSWGRRKLKAVVELGIISSLRVLYGTVIMAHSVIFYIHSSRSYYLLSRSPSPPTSLDFVLTSRPRDPLYLLCELVHRIQGIRQMLGAQRHLPARR